MVYSALFVCFLGDAGADPQLKYIILFIFLGGTLNLLANAPYFRAGTIEKALYIILIQIATNLLLGLLFDVFYFHNTPSVVSSFGCLIILASLMWRLFFGSKAEGDGKKMKITDEISSLPKNDKA